jgi:hypothetical protein
MALSFAAGFDSSSVWRYAGPSIGCGLLPALGVALALTCSLGKGLPESFRDFAIFVAFISLLGGMLAPALAE